MKFKAFNNEVLLINTKNIFFINLACNSSNLIIFSLDICNALHR